MLEYRNFYLFCCIVHKLKFNEILFNTIEQLKANVKELTELKAFKLFKFSEQLSFHTEALQTQFCQNFPHLLIRLKLICELIWITQRQVLEILLMQ